MTSIILSLHHSSAECQQNNKTLCLIHPFCSLKPCMLLYPTRPISEEFFLLFFQIAPFIFCFFSRKSSVCNILRFHSLKFQNFLKDAAKAAKHSNKNQLTSSFTLNNTQKIRSYHIPVTIFKTKNASSGINIRPIKIPIFIC